MTPFRCFPRFFPVLLLAVLGPISSAGLYGVGQYKNFSTAIYIPASVVQRFADPAVLQSDWDVIGAQLKVDKVYIETSRARTIVDEKLIEQVKTFFHDRQVQFAGGIAFEAGGAGQFESYCYTDPKDRAFVKNAVEVTARHFDEIILDDFFFVTTKYPSDIAAKGAKSWTAFRLELMDDVAVHLLLEPAKAIKPQLKFVIKFPNWYEHFQGLGYDLDKEPMLFDGIYTGTETREPATTDQHLQQYESYQIFRYFENIKPGGNGGGWVDTFDLLTIDRYAEQLWNTLFAKPPEVMLFNWAAMPQPVHPGEREAWASLPTSFDYNTIAKNFKPGSKGVPHEITLASMAGRALEQVDRFLGELGKPIGIASYKPYQSSGEDFLHNFFGMIGVPIDLHPDFPKDAATMLLTESAGRDPEIVFKIKGQLEAGKNVMITSGLLRALRGKGIEDIVEASCSDRKVFVQSYSFAFGAGTGRALGATQKPVLFPELNFLTNDAWPLIRGESDGNGFPILLLDHYGKGSLYILAIPDNFTDLYLLPREVLTAIKSVLMPDFFVSLDASSQVALYAYDNHTFIVESYLANETDVKVSLPPNFTHLREIAATGTVLSGEITPAKRGEASKASFDFKILPHSFRVFAAEP